MATPQITAAAELETLIAQHLMEKNKIIATQVGIYIYKRPTVSRSKANNAHQREDNYTRIKDSIE